VLERRLIPPGPLDVVATLGVLRRGPFDPTTRFVDGAFWRATRTPDGPATICVEPGPDDITVRAWGDGAEWAVETAPALLGFDDDPASFEPKHDIVREMHRRMPGTRQGRTDAVVEALVASIIEQKVQGMDAWQSYARLVRALGEPAPGPVRLTVPPDPARLAATPYWRYHRFGLERRRADTIRRVCARAPRLEECATLPMPEAYRRLTAFAGVGAWTAAEVARAALGDPDAVSVGDYHLPHLVAWALAGERRADDARMLELLEPYAGRRARAVRLIEGSGVGPPRRAPRMALRRIEAI